MDTNLLRSWLGLPPGPWPPEDRALLGLPAGPVDPTEAERRALAQMGKLRAHQLLHPELVTEGMNRLAQALLAVTATATPRDLPPPPPPPAPLFGRPQTAPTPDVAPLDLAPPPLDPRPMAPVVDAEPVLLAEPVIAPSPPPPLPPREIPPPVAPRLPPPEVVEVAIPVLSVGSGADDRRQAYRELAALRRLMRAWEQLGPFLGQPAADLAEAGDICRFLEGVAAYRETQQHPGHSPRFTARTAPRITALLEQPLVLAVFRSLVPAQRRAVAQEWALGRATWHARAQGLREALARSAPGRTYSLQQGTRLVLTHYPETVLVLATVVMTLAALIRRLAT